MGLIINQVFGSTGSSGIIGTVECKHGVQNVTCYVNHSTLASSNTFEVQTAIESSGPWFSEGSTAISTAASTTFRLQITGPVAPFIRARLQNASTGQFNVLFIGLD